MAQATFAVAGTHSTGKSTFLDAVANACERLGCRVARVTDLAREAHELGFPILRDHTFASTFWIMTRGIARRLEAGLHADVVLVDRPALDALGYLYAALEHRGALLSTAEDAILLQLAAFDAESYDTLCLTELDPALPLGPGRDTDLDFRRSAARHIGAVFAKLQLRPRHLTSDGAERAAVLAEALALASDLGQGGSSQG